ncbi:hypothetical protein NEAUS06_0233 [Nematocida ausubeli]|nr:hypothetical protein NEAUS06_0233 [Nematocida ausubeli]
MKLGLVILCIGIFLGNVFALGEGETEINKESGQSDQGISEVGSDINITFDELSISEVETPILTEGSSEDKKIKHAESLARMKAIAKLTNMDLDVDGIFEKIGKHTLTEEESKLIYKVDEDIERMGIPEDSVVLKTIYTVLLQEEKSTGKKVATKLVLGMYIYEKEQENPLLRKTPQIRVFNINE